MARSLTSYHLKTNDTSTAVMQWTVYSALRLHEQESAWRAVRKVVDGLSKVDYDFGLTTIGACLKYVFMGFTRWAVSPARS